jgi:hypothetical protein
MSVHDMIDDGFHPDLATTLASTLFALERLAGLRLSIVQTDHGRWALVRPPTPDDDPHWQATACRCTKARTSA